MDYEHIVINQLHNLVVKCLVSIYCKLLYNVCYYDMDRIIRRRRICKCTLHN